MERRTDYRHDLRYALSIQEVRSRRLIDHLETDSVSASGLSFRAGAAHGLRAGDRVEVQLVARAPGRDPSDALVMATRAIVVRATVAGGALRFEAPLAF